MGILRPPPPIPTTAAPPPEENITLPPSGEGCHQEGARANFGRGAANCPTPNAVEGNPLDDNYNGQLQEEWFPLLETEQLQNSKQRPQPFHNHRDIPSRNYPFGDNVEDSTRRRSANRQPFSINLKRAVKPEDFRDINYAIRGPIEVVEYRKRALAQIQQIDQKLSTYKPRWA